MSSKPNIVKRLFSALWRLVSLTRQVIVNIVFFVFFFAFIAVLSSDSEQVIVPEKTALVLNLVGDIVEQKFEIDPMEAFLTEALDEKEERPEILLSDLTDVIAKAKIDDRVEIIVLQLQGLHRTGLSKLQDIAAALDDFKSSGKRIIALGDQYTQDQYYLASVADEIWLNPEGFMLLEGYGRFRMYFKSALDKLAVNQHIFRVGTFKSAVEPYIRDDMSSAAKEANQLWLNDLWSQYKTDVAKHRNLKLNNFDDSITSLLTKFNEADASFAGYALNNQWVDHLKTRQEMRSELIDLVGKNKKGDSYSHISYKDYLAATTALPAMTSQQSDKVAIVVAKGTILNGTQKPGLIGGDSTAKLLRKARYNKSVKAVVLRVDSPGGSAYASEIIRQEIELLKQAGKPVIASMGTYAASGGYWISAPADKIYAAPSTITGSIGIFGMMMTFEDSLSKLGIHTDGVGTTDISGFGPTQPLTEEMATLIQLSINRGYKNFINLVATNRNMTFEQVDEIAQGRVWSGRKAKELGLVDELGNLTDATVAAAQLANLDNYDTLLIEKESSHKNFFLQKLFGGNTFVAKLVQSEDSSQLIDVSVPSLSNQPMSQLLNSLKAEVTKLNQFNDPKGIYSLCISCDVM
ncbi:signal peptide peptidase SppA [Litorilituus lipolyticus]|uniref:Signal peptide peptidase SppA n=1 Tax=Litorilituus lipolyticus TaxID=2491017 RepID=A0A502KS09_9GAMM|nr:signal peptide peptidase SppA [Litorilituus lipolyticus]TPH12811.1 signal peptide peptidase SppA [Litorilituus lipolyticus]